MVVVEEHGGVSVVRLDDGKVNVLDLELLRELAATFGRLVSADAVVLTGSGRAFSAGVDLRRVLDGGREYLAAFLPALSAAVRAVFDHPRPVVAAVNGHAIAGGCILVAACDWRVMSAGTIGVTELLVGVPFPPVVLEALCFAAGTATARLVLTGRTVPPSEARTLGLVDEVVEPDALFEHALGRAQEFARIPADAFTLTKAALRGPARERMAADEAAYADVVLDAWSSDACRQAIARYLDQLTSRRAGRPGPAEPAPGTGGRA